MSYVFDTNVFCQLFDSYYRNQFPTLWRRFDELAANDGITSPREVRREIGNHRVSTLRDWAGDNREIFPAPNADEAHVVNGVSESGISSRSLSVASFRRADSTRTLSLSRGRPFSTDQLLRWRAIPRTGRGYQTSATISESAACPLKGSWRQKTGRSNARHRSSIF